MMDIKELIKDVNELKERQDVQKRERTILSQNINSRKKQIAILEERISNNNQYELYKNK